MEQSNNDNRKHHRVAAIQLCSSHNVDDNLAMAAELTQAAVSKGAELIVLPENFAFMGHDDADRLQYKEEIGTGKIQNFLAALAKKNKIWLVGGTIPIQSSKPHKVYAACLVYNHEGTLAAHYNKIHLFDASIADDKHYHESKIVEAGRDAVVVNTPIGKLGLAICFDVRFPELFARLLKLGAEIIALPSAFTVPTGSAHWELLTRCRAIDTFSYVIAAGLGGKHTNGRKTYGHSLIIDPWGKIIAAKKDDQPGVIACEIDLSYVADCRQSIPLFNGV